ncbi:hypothetical protein E6C76_03355 [Pseudothauera nasutitermitis]|uniref:ParB/Sulfiredoxin domain-containing protein n=1 Tax=Pseudothauera nasutitermitis TaxID=2565930 RepID=A0A4S4B4A5_9RHOO|nr:hypothetical protein [Pseudothauera nasutitermitis]THF67415.1 hypothetical protein E6C76_03355 [Pseudothauera nasutitermitis]
MAKIIPDILKDHILPFDWDVRKVWELSADVIEVLTSEFVYLLKLPLWSSVSKQGLLFDICPMDVIHDPHASIYQAQRLQQTELRYPIEVLTVKGKRWVLDGVHRVAKSFTLNKSALFVRFHDESVIPSIKIG